MTSLANGQRVCKTDVRLEAYGTADELNSEIGLLSALVRRDVPELDATCLDWIQHRLFNLGALLSDAEGVWITEQDVAQMEQYIDAIQEELEPLRAFILPGGSVAVAHCHVARTIARRLERRMCEIKTDFIAMQWVNRLSDFLFVLSRKVAKLEKIEQLNWQK